MKKLINDLKHLVNPVKNMKKRNEPKMTDPASHPRAQRRISFTKRTQNLSRRSSPPENEDGCKTKPKYCVFNQNFKVAKKTNPFFSETSVSEACPGLDPGWQKTKRTQNINWVAPSSNAWGWLLRNEPKLSSVSGLNSDKRTQFKIRLINCNQFTTNDLWHMEIKRRLKKQSHLLLRYEIIQFLV
jgi:hypothetical protein